MLRQIELGNMVIASARSLGAKVDMLWDRTNENIIMREGPSFEFLNVDEIQIEHEESGLRGVKQYVKKAIAKLRNRGVTNGKG